MCVDGGRGAVRWIWFRHSRRLRVGGRDDFFFKKNNEEPISAEEGLWASRVEVYNGDVIDSKRVNSADNQAPAARDREVTVKTRLSSPLS
jgi:hypothetical protein